MGGMRSLLAVLITSSLARGRTSNAGTAIEEPEQYDPLYSVNLYCGHDSVPVPPPPPPPPAPPPATISTVEALNVASFDRLVARSELPWLVLYVSCVAAPFQTAPRPFPVPSSVSTLASLLRPVLHAWYRRSLPELQAYQQELRSQAVALAGHARLGWINCGDSGNDIICEEQTAGHSRSDENEGDGEGEGKEEAEHFDPTRLPALLMCGPSNLYSRNAERNASLLCWAVQVSSRQLGR
jgi:hypothetical protein